MAANDLIPIEQTDSQQSTALAAVYDYEMRLAAITPEERNHYLEISSKININDISSVSHYGSELSSVVASNGNALLQSVRGSNSSEVVALTNDLLAQLQLIDVDELNSNSGFKGFLRRLPFVKTLMKSVNNIMIKYDTIADNVDKISSKINSAKVVAMRDNGTLESIYTNNCTYIEQIRELIIAAKIRNEEITKEIDMMQSNPTEYPAYMVNDATIFQNALEKRIADMVTTEYILHQNLFQIRATQSNNIAIADKADNIVNHIIPIWKNQLALSIVMNNQKANIEAQRKVTETTNDILRKNAQALKTNSINVAKAAEETVVSLDTLRDTTNSLIETITEVKKIHQEGAKKRATIENTLRDFSQKLDAVLNERSIIK